MSGDKANSTHISRRLRTPQQGGQPASQQAQPGQQLMNPAPTMAFETAGPQHIEVEQFDGFGPMGTGGHGRLVTREKNVWNVAISFL